MISILRALVPFLLVGLAMLQASDAWSQTAGSVKLTESHLEGFIGVMPRLRAISARQDSSENADTLTSNAVGAVARTQQTMTELTDLLHQNGFKDAAEWGAVAASIATAYNWLNDADDPEKALNAQIAEITAETSLSESQKVLLIAALEGQRAMIVELKPPAENLALVGRYRDKIAAALED